MEFLVKLTLSV